MDRNEKDKDLNFIYIEKTNDERFLDQVIRAESKGVISDEQNTIKFDSKDIKEESLEYDM